MPLPIDIEDLLGDESFLAWYFKTNTEDISAWDNRLTDNPELKKVADEAGLLLRTIKLKERPVDSSQLYKSEKLLMNTINNDGNHHVKALFGKNKFIWRAAAAVFIFFAGWGAWQYYSQHNKLAFRTRYGEIKKEIFPDGSQVTLNANTEITYSKGWQDGNDREIWIKGEAFFEVQKTAAKSRFIVHSGLFDVIVTGTKFNVTNRADRNNVLLREGSVTIKSAEGSAIFMKPGEFVEYANTQFYKKKITDTLLITWKEHKLIFEKTPMKEVAASIKEIYGIKVTLADDFVASTPVSGIFPNDNLDIFLKSLEISQNFGIEKNGQEILIRRR